MSVEDIVKKSPHRRDVVEVGPFALNLNTRRAKVFGKELPLIDKEFTLLLALLWCQGSMVTREMLYVFIWRAWHTETSQLRAVDVQVCRLRRKLDAVSANVRFQVLSTNSLHSEIGVGYKLKFFIQKRDYKNTKVAVAA